MGLYGTIPSKIGMLTELTTLSFGEYFIGIDLLMYLLEAALYFDAK